jgi:hypothetical protein
MGQVEYGDMFERENGSSLCSMIRLRNSPSRALQLQSIVRSRRSQSGNPLK